MATVATKLTKEQTQILITNFLEKLGFHIKAKRERLNLSQKELADCLGIEQSTLSKYEKGTRDMNVSYLPLLSVYCKFQLNELFPSDESKLLLNIFSTAVTIVSDRKRRQQELQERKAKVIHENKSIRESYKDAEIESTSIPFNEEEFCTYLKTQAPVGDAVINAGKFLLQINDEPRRETLKGAVADYIIDELIIEPIIQRNQDDMTHRLYAYYRELYKRNCFCTDKDTHSNQ